MQWPQRRAAAGLLRLSSSFFAQFHLRLKTHTHNPRHCVAPLPILRKRAKEPFVCSRQLFRRRSASFRATLRPRPSVRRGFRHGKLGARRVCLRRGALARRPRLAAGRGRLRRRALRHLEAELAAAEPPSVWLVRGLERADRLHLREHLCAGHFGERHHGGLQGERAHSGRDRIGVAGVARAQARASRSSRPFASCRRCAACCAQ